MAFVVLAVDKVLAIVAARVNDKTIILYAKQSRVVKIRVFKNV